MENITLNQANFDNNSDVMNAFNNRQSLRSYADTPLSIKELSNILWSAWGINRKDGRRTAPSARNTKNITLYAVLKEGAYKYVPEDNILQLVAEGDFRKETGIQPFVKEAPLNIIFVASPMKIEGVEIDKETETACSYMTVGGISENIYIYCASANLATVARASIDKEVIAKILKLSDEDKVLYAQSIGHQM